MNFTSTFGGWFSSIQPNGRILRENPLACETRQRNEFGVFTHRTNSAPATPLNVIFLIVALRSVVSSCVLFCWAFIRSASFCWMKFCLMSICPVVSCFVILVSVYAECTSAMCHSFRVILLYIILLRVILLCVILLPFILLCVILLQVIMVIVVVPDG
jgi:hypothetical protein